MGEVLFTQSESKTEPASSDQSGRHPDNQYTELFSGWYIFRQGRFWCLTNILAASLAGVLAAESMSTALLASWVIFIFLNAVLLLNVINFTYSQNRQQSVKNDDPFLFFAAIFGASWGGLLFFAGQYLEQAQHLSLQIIALGIAGTAIPVFALYKGAYTIFSLSLLMPCIAAQLSLSEPDLSTFFSAFFFVYIAAAYLATTQTALVAMLVNFLKLGDNTHRNRGMRKDFLPGVVENRLRKIKRQLPDSLSTKSSLDAIGDGIVIVDADGVIEYMNPTAEVMIGAPTKHVCGDHLSAHLILNGREVKTYLSEIFERLRVETGERLRSEETLIRSDGIEYEIEFIAIPHFHETNKPDGLTLILRESPATAAFTKEHSWRIKHDPLTHLFNRLEFENRLNALFKPGGELVDQTHAICVSELDDLQYLNETMGYRTGDKALLTLASEFQAKIRGADILARLGDKKFGILLYACELDKARMIAEGLRRLVEQANVQHDEHFARLTVSIGIVAFNPKADTASDVLIAADAACARAKKDGGNRVFTLIEEENTASVVSKQITQMKKIRSALQDNELLLQTRIVRLATSTLNGEKNLSVKETDRQCEILLRMKDELGKLIAPRESLAAANRFQIMSELDRWAAKATLDAIRLNHPALSAMRMLFINISGQSLNDDEFVDFLVAELEDENLETERLCFEISHTSLIASSERAANFIARLKEYDCKISLRDVGLGIEALNLLKNLQVDFLKIDPHFIRNMIHHSVDYEIVLAFVRIAKTMGVQTIAAGVETVALKEALTGMGIDYLQGMQIGEPALLETRRLH